MSDLRVEYQGGSVQARSVGLDFKLWKKLKQGEYPIQAVLDLHGFKRDQAAAHLHRFIEQAYLQGHRSLLIIHGRGLRSEDGIPVLKDTAVQELSASVLARLILGFCSALPKDGGQGAVYVLLRRQR